MQTVARLLIALALINLSASVYANEPEGQAEFKGQFKAWRVYCDPAYCWAYTPLEDNKEISMIAFVREKDKIEPSVYSLSLGETDKVRLVLRDKLFPMRVYTSTDQAYTDQEHQEPDVIRAFMKQHVGTLEINEKTDSFSLLGFAKALDHAKTEFELLKN